MIIERSGIKIGLFGVVDQSYVFSTVCSKKMVLTSYLDVAEKMVKLLRGQGCHLIIALTHMMNKSDENL